MNEQDEMIPDPRHDFGGWVAARERRAWEEIKQRARTPADLAVEGPKVFEELYDEIDAMEEALGIPVAPVDPAESEEIARRLLAANVAYATMSIEPLPPGLLPEEREARFAEASDRLLERIEAILRGEIAGDEIDRAETVAREDLARLYERRSRGEPSYVAFANQLRATRFFGPPRFGQVSRSALPRTRRVGRPRERRAGSRSRRVRAGPSSSDDGSADPPPPCGAANDAFLPSPSFAVADQRLLERKSS